MDHRFDGPRYSVGIEEELMIIDSSTLDLVNAIDAILGEDPPTGQIQPELLESVLEIATSPCATVAQAGEELRSLRGLARDRARGHGLEIGSSGTHPFARWEDQRVVSDDRYRGLIRSLGFVARQELVFGMHVHVGMADPEEAIYVANALREHVPLLIALSANSPLWRGEPTGLMSSRVPIFRAFPRVGLPPHFAGWQDFARRVKAMSDGGLIEDYTFLWYDVRPHPRLGTVEIRAIAQPRPVNLNRPSRASDVRRKREATRCDAYSNAGALGSRTRQCFLLLLRGKSPSAGRGRLRTRAVPPNPRSAAPHERGRRLHRRRLPGELRRRPCWQHVPGGRPTRMPRSTYQSMGSAADSSTCLARWSTSTAPGTR